MFLFHLGDQLIDGFGMQTMKLHCCRVPACKVLKHKGKPPGKLLAGGRKLVGRSGREKLHPRQAAGSTAWVGGGRNDRGRMRMLCIGPSYIPPQPSLGCNREHPEASFMGVNQG